MNRPDNFEDDILRQFIDTARIDKAPEGFTQKVMTRVRFETKPDRIRESLWRRIRIPAISASITLILAIIASILPDTGAKTPPGLKFIQNISLPDFKFNFDSYFNFNLPVLVTYLLVAIVFLLIFDKALSGLFHRGKKYPPSPEGF
jgi:hypothetical protein